MTKGKETAEPQGMEPLSLKVERSVWDRLNFAAKEMGRSKASIIREGLFVWLNTWEQSRGAK